jgi:N-methylhydantoinase A
LTHTFVGIDVGGTFTDFVVLRNGQLTVHKVSTTPDDQSRAIVAGLNDLGLWPPSQAAATATLSIVHGMTIATNALLERRGARTALITTAGFGDILVIGRQNRPHLYRLHQARPPLLAADEWRFEVEERLDAQGNVLTPLNEGQVAAVGQRLHQAGTESVAIVFLYSFRNPQHEQRAAAILRAQLPSLPISLSSEILPEYREYERSATTVINAYVQPLVARYLARIEDVLQVEQRPAQDIQAKNNTAPGATVASIRIMQSNGGAIGLAQAAKEAARLVLSGPAGGVVGAFALAKQATPAYTLHNAPSSASAQRQTEETKGDGEAGAISLLTFDMGGTSTDVALCPGQILTTAESEIAGLPLRLPIIDIHTVGAGGGSIAKIDSGGALHVGPRSAGAAPGPACYGHGGNEPTVTDANLVLGRLDPAGFLGGHGDVHLDVQAARQVFDELASQLHLSIEAAALGVLRVANATMERALRHVSVERGYDPRQFTLLPFGGAGPLHACDLAQALGINRILIPLFPGVLSAYGMLAANIAHDDSQSILIPAVDLLADAEPLQRALAGLEQRTRAVLRQEGVEQPALTASLDMRYRGQSYELTVDLCLPFNADTLQAAIALFHQTHSRRYGYAMHGQTVEVVTLRLRGSAPGADVALPDAALDSADASNALIGYRPVWFDQAAPIETPCYQRERLRPGNRFAGPALVFQYDATSAVLPGWQAWIDEYRSIWLTRPDSR